MRFAVLVQTSHIVDQCRTPILIWWIFPAKTHLNELQGTVTADETWISNLIVSEIFKFSGKDCLRITWIWFFRDSITVSKCATFGYPKSAFLWSNQGFFWKVAPLIKNYRMVISCSRHRPLFLVPHKIKRHSEKKLLPSNCVVALFLMSH